MASIQSCSSVSYAFHERIVRLCMFQFKAFERGFLEYTLYRLYQIFLKFTCSSPFFDEARSEAALDAMKGIGGREAFVSADDGMANVHVMTFKARDLENTLLSFGATWERIGIRDAEGNVKTVMAIIPPENPEDSNGQTTWTAFAEGTLKKFPWSPLNAMHNGSLRELIITCDNAERVTEDKWHQNSFFHTHATSHTFTYEKARVAYLLGMKQDLCFFDCRGIGKSRGIPSEKGFYNDAKAAYRHMQSVSSYDPKNIYLTGFCAGAPVAASLKADLHGEGVNFIEEHSYSNLRRDFIGNMNFIARFFALWGIAGLKAKDIPPESGTKECEFSIEELWRDLPHYQGEKGKIIHIHPTNDDIIPRDSVDRFVDLSRRVNDSVQTIWYHSKGKKHSDDFFRYAPTREAFQNAIFA